MVQSLAISPNEKWLASGSYDEILRVTNLSGGLEVYTFHGHKGIVNTICWLKDNQTLLSGGYDGCLYLHDIKKKTSKKIFELPSTIKSLQWNHSSKLLAIGSNDGVVRVMTLEAKMVYSSTPDTALINELAWSPQGDQIVSAGRSKNLIIHDIRKKTSRLFKIGAHRKSIKSVSWSKDGLYLLTGSYDESVKIWDYKKQALLKQIFQHQGGVSRVRFSSDSKKVVTASWDSKLRFFTFDGTMVSHYNHQQRRKIC